MSMKNLMEKVLFKVPTLVLLTDDVTDATITSMVAKTNKMAETEVYAVKWTLDNK